MITITELINQTENYQILTEKFGYVRITDPQFFKNVLDVLKREA